MAGFELIDESGTSVFRGTQRPPSGGSQPFTPTDLNIEVGSDWNPLTVLGWWDASDAATIHEADASGFVSKWDDKSGNGNDLTQATAESQPTTGTESIGGLNAVGFDGTATFLDSALVLATEFFLLLVFKGDAGMDLDNFNYALFSEAATSAELKVNNSEADPQLQTASIAVGMTKTAPTVAAVAQGEPVGGFVTALRRDGVASPTDAAQDFGEGALEVGAVGGASDFFQGAIAALIYVKGLLTPEQQQRLLVYAADKWGITL